MATHRANLPVRGIVSVGILVLGLFLALNLFGPDYVVIPFGNDSANYESVKEALRERGVSFIGTESELWIPRRELQRLRVDPASSLNLVSLAERLRRGSEPSSSRGG